MYSCACHNVLAIILEYVEALKDERWWLYDSKKMQQKLLSTGVFIQQDGQLDFISPIYQQRLGEIVTSDNLLGLVKKSDCQTILQNLVQYKPKTELLSIPYLVAMNELSGHESIFDSLKHFMNYMGFAKLHIMLREADQRKVWYDYTINSHTVQKIASSNEDCFIKAALTGTQQYDEEAERLWIPIQSDKGFIQIIVVGLVTNKNNKKGNIWRRNKLHRKYGYLIKIFHQVIERAVENYLYENQEKRHYAYFKKQQNLSHKPIDSLQHILYKSGANAVALLKPSNEKGTTWFPFLIQPMRKYNKVLFQAEHLVISSNSQQLSIIKKSHKQDFIISNEAKIKEFFSRLPMTNDKKYTLFLKPLFHQEADRQTQTVLAFSVFLFCSEKSKKEGKNDLNHGVQPPIIDRTKFRYLSSLSAQMSALLQTNRNMLKKQSKEAELFKKISRLLPNIQVDPDTVEQQLVDLLQDHFQVEAVSLSEVITLDQQSTKKQQIRVLAQVGYTDGIFEVIYMPEDNHQKEGSTGWLVRNQCTLMTQKKSDGLYDYRYDSDTGTLRTVNLTFNQGHHFCEPYLEQGLVHSFMGTIVPWQSEAGDEVIGVIKLVNLQSGGNFSIQDAAALERIARLIAPAIYLLQNRGEFGAHKRLESMEAMMRGIGHEFTAPLSKIRNTCELIKLPSTANTLPDNYIHDVNNVQRWARGLQEMVKDLREVALQEPGNPMHCSANELANTAWCYVQEERLVPASICLHNHLANDITIVIDKNKGIRAFYLLMHNAVEALVDQPIGQIHIDQQGIIQQGYVTIQVQDNGPGVPQGLIDNLFDPWRSGHEHPYSTGQPNKQRGLGLTLVRAIIENAGGTIQYNYVEGACFTLRLPV